VARQIGGTARSKHTTIHKRASTGLAGRGWCGDGSNHTCPLGHILSKYNSPSTDETIRIIPYAFCVATDADKGLLLDLPRGLDNTGKIVFRPDMAVRPVSTFPPSLHRTTYIVTYGPRDA